MRRAARRRRQVNTVESATAAAYSRRPTPAGGRAHRAPAGRGGSPAPGRRASGFIAPGACGIAVNSAISAQLRSASGLSKYQRAACAIPWLLFRKAQPQIVRDQRVRHSAPSEPGPLPPRPPLPTACAARDAACARPASRSSTPRSAGCRPRDPATAPGRRRSDRCRDGARTAGPPAPRWRGRCAPAAARRPNIRRRSAARPRTGSDARSGSEGAVAVVEIGVGAGA